MMPMKKPKPFKIIVPAVLIAMGVAGLVAFATFWPASKPLSLSTEVQAKEISNGSRFGGRVIKVLVKEGDRVKKDELLVEFDGVDLKSQIAEAEASLSQAIAREQLLRKGADNGQIQQAGATVSQSREKLKLLSKGTDPELIQQSKGRVDIAHLQYQETDTALNNAGIMLNKGIISQQKYDDTQQKKALAKKNLEIAEAALKQAKNGYPAEEKRSASAQLAAATAQYHQLVEGARPEEIKIATANVLKAKSALAALKEQQKEVQIRAPFSGYVSVLSVTEGELIPPGQPVVSILNYDNLWADVFVPESRLASIHLKQAVSIKSHTLRKSQFKGYVSTINPKSEFLPSSGSSNSSEEAAFRVKVSVNGSSVNNKEAALYPGMKIDITFDPS
jgi:HlyD family secretion protein